jgi:hypothetical protein
MKVEKSALALGESADIHHALRLDAHALERRLVGHWRDNERA